MWEQAGVLFVTVNIPGGSNNDADVWYGAATASGEQTQEADLRTGADLRWLDAAFAQAKADKVAGVVIQTQADMWDLDGKTASHLANYEPFVSDIASNTTSFGKPVLLFNGDSHVFRSDNPLVQGAPCCRGALLRSRRVAVHRRRLGDASVVQRSELPSDRRARQHVPARVSPRVGEHAASAGGGTELFRAVQLGARPALGPVGAGRRGSRACQRPRARKPAAGRRRARRARCSSRRRQAILEEVAAPCGVC